MLTLRAQRDALLLPLQSITGIVERRHTLPILSNVLLEHQANRLSLTATDLEIQIKSHASMAQLGDAAITVSARKLQDILRALPGDKDVALEAKDSKLSVRSGASRFSLQVLPAQDFPVMAAAEGEAQAVEVPQRVLRALLAKTYFAMAQQDIRYYLNGMLFSLSGSTLRLVATDGHRLGMASHGIGADMEAREAILPRKAIIELTRLLAPSDDLVKFRLRANQARFEFGDIELVTKVIDGKFPDYSKVIPAGYSKRVRLNRAQAQQALQRAAILSSDKIRGVRLTLTKDNLAISCSNNEQEEAQEDLTIAYEHEPLDVGFNLSYLLDVLNHVEAEEVELSLGDSSSSALITIPDDPEFKYVVMPMRI